MFSHEVGDIMMHKYKTPYKHQFRLAKVVAFIIGIFALAISFYYSDLMELFKLFFDCFIPIVTVPFILAILGFRSDSRNVLLGMTMGMVAIFFWNKWVEPTTQVNGAFPCMLANGLVMVTAHYLWPRSKERLMR